MKPHPTGSLEHRAGDYGPAPGVSASILFALCRYVRCAMAGSSGITEVALQLACNQCGAGLAPVLMSHPGALDPMPRRPLRPLRTARTAPRPPRTLREALAA